MRQGIYTDTDGIRTVDIQKALGRGYNNGWFTNTRNIRYRLFKGARNTKKSVIMLGYEPILRMISDDITNILIVRKNDVDNRNSTFAGLLRAISDLGLEAYFKTRLQPLEIEHVSGRKIIFAGLNNPTSLNSIAFKVGYLTAVYIEEAFEIDSWDAFVKLDQSVRAGMNYNEKGELVEINVPQQITMCFNAWSNEHWLYTEFFHKAGFEDDVEYLEHHKYMDFKDPNFAGPYGTGVYLHISTYKANEFRDRKQVDAAAEAMKVASYDQYATLFLGCWGNATETVYPEFRKDKNVIPFEELKNFVFTNFAIGIDTGMSVGDGTKPRILKTDDPAARVKAANTMTLGAITPGFKKIVAIDEYFHSNNPQYMEFNTDNKDNLNINEQAYAILYKIVEWIEEFEVSRKEIRNDMLMKGTINVYIDSADIGFRQLLQLCAKDVRLKNGLLLSSRVRFYGSTKTKIWDRVQFERVMFGFQDMLYSNRCKNLIRETCNARKGEHGEARLDGNDHQINSFEYSTAPYRNSFVRWKLFDKSEETN